MAAPARTETARYARHRRLRPARDYEKVRVRFSVGGVLHRAYTNLTMWEDATGRQFNHSVTPAVTSVRIALEVKG